MRLRKQVLNQIDLHKHGFKLYSEMHYLIHLPSTLQKMLGISRLIIQTAYSTRRCPRTLQQCTYCTPNSQTLIHADIVLCQEKGMPDSQTLIYTNNIPCLINTLLSIFNNTLMYNRFSNLNKYKYPFKRNIIFKNAPTAI